MSESSRDPGFFLISAGRLKIGQILAGLLVSMSSFVAQDVQKGVVDIAGHMASIAANIQVCSVDVQQSPDGAGVAAE